jgi:site-specific DNA-methyltransferase (adenine-specific)
MLLLNGDCLELMKTLEDKSIDLIFCDLPYGQTSCKWDCPIDLELFWIEVMRIKKLNTPIFFTTTTKFGVSLINSAPKKCFFRYDIVWVKSSPAGFLCAKKMPMRKHEMIYVFYEKLPFYDLSSHQHKFLKPNTPMGDKPDMYGRLWDKNGKPYVKEKQHSQYDPPLPVSVVKEEKTQISQAHDKDLYGASNGGTIGNVHGTNYDPPLPNSMLEIKSTRGKHSTEKPVALMEWVLKYYSKEGDTILDPTMGSGSTGVACKNMNRNFIGIEMDEEIFKVAEGRCG